MSRVPSTGTLQLHFLPGGVSNLAAPTTTEINAGTNLTEFLLRNGLKTPKTGTTIDAADMSSRYNKTGRGSFGGQPVSAVFYRDDDSDDAWDLLPPDTEGVLVVLRFGGGGALGAVQAGDAAECWPVEVVSREMMDTADNEMQKFTVTFSVPDDPNDDATVA